jgi:hypothetical protein
MGLLAWSSSSVCCAAAAEVHIDVSHFDTVIYYHRARWRGGRLIGTLQHAVWLERCASGTERDNHVNPYQNYPGQ